MALGYFGYTAFQGATVFYLTVGELLNGGAEAGKTVRVSGKLVADSFRREPQGTVAHFSLTDGRQTLPATYNGVVPELFFNEQSDIVLEGYYDTQGVFQSREIIVKCPSKYEAVASPATSWGHWSQCLANDGVVFALRGFGKAGP